MSAVAPPTLPVAALRAFVAVDPAPRCHLCAVPLSERHRHLLGEADDVVCACPPCHLLFPPSLAGAWRAIDDRVLHDPQLDGGGWDDLGLPVGLAILQHGTDGLTARFPGPAGVVDGHLDPDAAAALAAATPLLGMLEPHVEVLLAHRTHAGVRILLAPVTAAFELVARLRDVWDGLAGGPAVQQAVDEVFTDLERRSQPVRPVTPPPADHDPDRDQAHDHGGAR